MWCKEEEEEAALFSAATYVCAPSQQLGDDGVAAVVLASAMTLTARVPLMLVV